MSQATGQATREIRVALVLYGGISLAVYENGVTRCFYELIKGEGIFGVILAMLGAEANVDVIAGTSAGGINGLILAACLESGQDFRKTAEIWRDLGDFGFLLRRVSSANTAESLLDTEAKYYASLRKNFDWLCQPTGGPVHDKEMDVFITATDIDGHPCEYVDGLGATIQDKEHRTLFHLEYRPDRKSLGLPAARFVGNLDLKATVFASLAQITSSFPVAFSPFRATEGSDLAAALEGLSTVRGSGSALYMDGGVLDNKPFGPALEAIFHRMPYGPVTRHLFYVEPDPEPRLDQPGGKPPEHYTPLAIVLNAVNTIPAHETISGDLDRLLEHNERIAWLRELEKGVPFSNGAKASTTYVTARIECAARALAQGGESAPRPTDVPANNAERQLILELRQEFRAWFGESLQGQSIEARLAETLDPYDVYFHLRRAFRLLYQYIGEIDAPSFGSQPAPARERKLATLGLVSRIIKALKMIRDYAAAIRERTVERAGPAWRTSADGAPVVALARKLQADLIAFLDEKSVHWTPLIDDLRRAGPLTSYVGRPKDFLSRTVLERCAGAIRAGAAPAARSSSLASRTILSVLADALRAIALWGDGEAYKFDMFDAFDYQLFPLGFTSGVYELDEINFVRISPQDSQLGLCEKEAHKKIAGDELAHFSAFFRRDWRSNDLIYGRLDGICQIIRALLNAEGLRHALVGGTGALTAPALVAAVPACPASRRQAVLDAWAALAQDWGAATAEDARAKVLDGPAAQRLREALICAAHEQVIAEDLESLYADMLEQDIQYEFAIGRSGALSSSNPSLIRQDARKLAGDMVSAILAADRWATFDRLELGNESISGDEGRVPPLRLGEYATHSYLLLWGMIEKSLGTTARRFLSHGRVRLVLRSPLYAMNRVFWLLRRDRKTASLAVFASIIAVVGAVIWALSKSGLRDEIGIWAWPLVAIAVAAVLLAAARAPRRRSLAKILPS